MNGNVAMDLARWPNNTDGNPFTLNSLRNDGGSGQNISNGAYLTSSKIPNINWKGGAVFFYGDRPGSGWIAWKAAITSSSSGRVNFNLDKNPTWIRTFHDPASKGDFYLEGVKGALDYANEWWFDTNTKELFVQMPNGSVPVNGKVQMRKRNVAIDLNQRSFIEIRNLAVFGGSVMLKSNSNNNKLYGISSFYGNHTQGIFKGFNAGKSSIEVNGTNNIVEKSEIAFSAATGVRLGGNQNKLINNYIHDFNYLGSYDAPLVARGGTDNKILRNTIFNAGRDGINFNGNRCEIAYNDVSKSNLINDDCALFYTVGGPQNTEIHHNWFHDAQGRGKLKKAAGIYLDNDAEAFSVHHNVVWNVEWTNIQINWNGKDLDIFNNTLVKAQGGTMGAWHKAGTQFYNVKVWNNITDKRAEDQGGNQETEVTWEPQSDKQNNLIDKTSFVNYASNDFKLKPNSLAVDYGRVINGITNGYRGNAPDVGAYEYGDNWKAGIDWNPLLGPTGLGCYGLPGETCSTNNDTISFLNAETEFTSKTTYTIPVSYTATTNREIVVELWSSTGWLTETKVSVTAGSGTKDVVLNLNQAPDVGTNYILKTHIRPINTNWQEAIDRDQIDNININNYNNEVSFVNPQLSIQSSNSYNFTINYEASDDREIIVAFWDSSGWVAQNSVTVSSGTGTKNITVSLPSKPIPGSGYIYKAHIKPVGGTWQQAFDWDQVNNVTVLPSQIISNGVYNVKGLQYSQLLTSNGTDNHNVFMNNDSGLNSQNWLFTHTNNNYYTIKNVSTNRFLEVPYGACQDRSNVATWLDAKDNHKIWKIEKNCQYFSLKPKHCETKSLDRAAGAVNANVQIWGYFSGNNNQKWIITPVNTSKLDLSKGNPSNNDVTVYPVPATNILNVSFKSALNSGKINIYDVSGNLLVSKKILANSKHQSVSVSNLSSGIYFLQIDSEVLNTRFKFIKK